MASVLWVLAFVAAALLLAVSTYAALVGMAALFGASYERCSRCHHHYLAVGGHLASHACPHGPVERLYHRSWEWRHRTHHASH